MSELERRCTEIVGAPHLRQESERLVVRPDGPAAIVRLLEVARATAARVGVGSRRGLALDLGRLDAVLHLDELSAVVTAQAGIEVQALEAQLAPRGLSLGTLPPQAGRRSLGALLAAPRPAEAAPRDGRFTARCMALGAILPDGTEIATRSAPRKATGPDLMHALLGTRGTLGLITSATLRLLRQPAHSLQAAWELPSLKAAAEAARALLLDGGRPADLRVLDGPPVLLWLRAAGDRELVEAELTLARRHAEAHGGKGAEPVEAPPTSDPLEERALSLAQVTAVTAAPGGRLEGWHPGGVARISPGPSLRAEVPPIVQLLKEQLDPAGVLVPWPGA